MTQRLAAIVLVMCTALILGGCATSRLVDTDVTAFSAWQAAPAAPGTTYRFERLPSQQFDSQLQDRIEAMAQTSLSRVGMVLSPPSAKLSVQVVANSQRVERIIDDGFMLGGPGVFVGPGGYGPFGGFGGFGPYGGFGGFPNRFGELYYQREVSIQVRDLASNQVVYETKARHDGPWSDTFVILPVMFDAALVGFPQPAPGTRRVDIQISR